MNKGPFLDFGEVFSRFRDKVDIIFHFFWNLLKCYTTDCMHGC